MCPPRQSLQAAWLVAALGLAALGCGAGPGKLASGSPVGPTGPVAPTRHAPFFHAGFAYSRIGGSYDSDVSSVELGKMADAGGNIVQLLAFAYVHELDGPSIGMEGEGSDRVLRGGIARAKAAGLRVMVKLQMWGPGFHAGKYAANIGMTNDADWRAFLAGYREYVLRYARLAAETDVDVLCIGTELAQASQAPVLTGGWRALADEVRGIYDGPITYAAHHTEVEGVHPGHLRRTWTATAWAIPATETGTETG